MNKLIGVLITALSQIDEVAPFSNAVAFKPCNGAELVQYLDEIDNRMVPVVIVDHFFTVNDIYQTGFNHELYYALEQSKHFGRIVFMFDEPMWRASHTGQSYSDVLNVMHDVKRNYPGVEIMHVEAYAELYNQYMANDGKLTLFYEADHIGFDCYGEYAKCGGSGVPHHAQFIYLNEINKALIENNSDAKLFLVPSAFVSPNWETDQLKVVEQLRAYIFFFENNLERVSGIGAFAWGSSVFGDTSITGARECDLIREELETKFPKLGKKLDEFRLILD